MKQITTLLVTLLFFTGICLAQDEDLTAEAAALRELVAAAERAALEPDKPTKPTIKELPGNIEEAIPSFPSPSEVVKKDPTPPASLDRVKQPGLPKPPSGSAILSNAPLSTIQDKVTTSTAPLPPGLPNATLKSTTPASANIEKPIAEFKTPKPPEDSIEINSDLRKKVEEVDPIAAEIKKVRNDTAAAASSAAAAASAISQPKPTVKRTTTNIKPKEIKKQVKVAEEPVAIAKKAEQPTAAAAPKRKGKKLGEILFPKRGGIFKKKQQQP